ncbi:MAG: DMT family transporter [Geminicoccaceae bacterium]
MAPRAEVRGDNIPLAIVVILLTVLALSLGDALIKQTSASFVLWQIFVLRSIIAIPVLLVIIRLRYASVPWVPKAIGWTSLRSLMLTLMWIAYYAALPNLELSIAAAAYYTLPIFITLFSALLVGEAVGRVGWVAIALGFVGVLLILKPAAGDFNAYALLPLVSAMLFALAMILTRTKCRNEHPLILSLTLNISFIAVGLAASLVVPLMGEADTDTFLIGSWSPMGADEWLAMSMLATSILIGSVGAAIAYQSGPSSLVATFDFAYVGFASVWGLIFFGEVPDAIALAGMIMIVAAGVISVRR